MGRYKTKQLIIVRKDLNMPAGKMAAQVAHASVAALVENDNRRFEELSILNTPASKEWLEGDFAKIVLEVQDKEQLIACYELANSLGFRTSKIIDNGTTVFNGVKTLTCIGIGPEYSYKLDAAFSHLKLYQ